MNIYAVKTGECLGRLAGHTQRVNGVAICPWNQDRAITWSVDGTVRVWNTADDTCCCVDTYRFAQEVTRVVLDTSLQGGCATNRTVVVLLGPQVTTAETARENAARPANVPEDEEEEAPAKGKGKGKGRKKFVSRNVKDNKNMDDYKCAVLQGTRMFPLI